jgi:hypothetical protein
MDGGGCHDTRGVRVDPESDRPERRTTPTAMRRLIAALLLLIPLAAACDSPTTGSAQQAGKLTGTLNGAPWNGDAVSGVHRDTTYISSGHHGGSPERRITAAVVASGPGEYAVIPARSRGYYELVGGDVVTYSAAVTQGTVTFTENGPASTHARGSIQLTISGARGVWQFSGQFEAPRVIYP